MAPSWSLTLATSLLALPSLISASRCQGQSCYIAYISGSTAKKYDLPGPATAAGASSSGETCIKTHLQEMKDLGGNMPKQFARYADKQAVYRTVMDAAPLAREAWLSKNATDESKQACESTIMIYARGTLEPGENGITLGPPLVAGAKAAGWGGLL